MYLSSIYQQKQNNFDFLRFFLASLVFYSHSFVLFSGKPLSELKGEIVFYLTRGQIDGGILAVNMFFLISGFLITISWFNSSTIITFSTKRIARIFPGLIGVFIVVIFLLGPLFSSNYSDYFHQLSFSAILHDLLTMNISQSTVDHMFASLPKDTINGSLWTLKYEMYCYILILLLGAFKLLTKKTVTILFILFFITYMFQTYGSLELTRGVPIPRLFTYFLLGSLYYFYKDHILFNTKNILILILILFFLSAFEFTQLSIIISFSYLLFAFAYSPIIKLYNFSKMGDLSYGMYIYAFPMQQATLLIFKEIEFQWYFTISFILTLILSYLSWHFIEKPSLQFAHNYRFYQSSSSKKIDKV